MDNNLEKLQKLQEALPPHFASIIAKALNEKYEPYQVRGVFNGTITNPDIVLEVLEQAWKLHSKMQKIKKLTEKAETLS